MQRELLDKINSVETELTQTIQLYWETYTSFDTWQFWVCLITFVTPLVAFYFLVDRRKIFMLSFYGYTYHVFLSYLDAFMNRHNFWEYPYFMFPFLSSNIAIDASLLPVSYLLLYQYTLNHKKNFYLISFLLSLFYAFIYAGILQKMNMFNLTNGMNNVYLLFIDYGLALISFWLTSFFGVLQKNALN